MAGRISLVFLVALLLIMTLGVAFFGDKIPFIRENGYQVVAPAPTANPSIHSHLLMKNLQLQRQQIPVQNIS